MAFTHFLIEDMLRQLASNNLVSYYGNNANIGNFQYTTPNSPILPVKMPKRNPYVGSINHALQYNLLHTKHSEIEEKLRRKIEKINHELQQLKKEGAIRVKNVATQTDEIDDPWVEMIHIST